MYVFFLDTSFITSRGNVMTEPTAKLSAPGSTRRGTNKLLEHGINGVNSILYQAFPDSQVIGLSKPESRTMDGK
jgi:hypothetical protein